jgi:hypothetical protein
VEYFENIILIRFVKFIFKEPLRVEMDQQRREREKSRNRKGDFWAA